MDTDDPPGFTLFDTPIGPCALVWSARGLIGVALPDARAQVRRRFRGAHDRAPPPDVQRAVERVLALLQGAMDDLQDIALDLRGLPAFNTRVYAIARRIPPGATRSYGEIARELGEPSAARGILPGRAARAVGQALGANPFPIIVPCHRVLAAGHRAGGFSAPGGARTKLRLLEIEGAPLGGTPGLFDN
ncbi:MAG TPA: methylated-DNA--[protein]-cysteine S-methyltransferase [Burkholderiaceae bacterium]|nr:methylated-DNA--[protein]-cysteine S-methyltransferase [Burkholderiaceae bacterium]